MMRLKTLLGFISISIAFPAFLSGRVDAAEKTIAVCQTARQTMRIYRLDGKNYLRAINRRDGIVWMNRTPVSTESNPEGTLYTNLRGEQTVKVFVYRNGRDCSIEIGKKPPESGKLLPTGSIE
ncbi:hypothetical protein V0288_22110 [Pannus brasiliensis CCIBt3594]|uniref:Uncharacterized protein n=1 Tax=Pannus brasiliensis CCIBt3594 TaxID=1427578 RepID=A0AAW9R1E9_9CHRO